MPIPGWGISLGDDCVVEAGLYVTGGTKVTTSDGQTVKAKDLSGADNLLFRRNSLSGGAVEVVSRDGTGITLNDACTPTDAYRQRDTRSIATPCAGDGLAGVAPPWWPRSAATDHER